MATEFQRHGRVRTLEVFLELFVRQVTLALDKMKDFVHRHSRYSFSLSKIRREYHDDLLRTSEGWCIGEPGKNTRNARMNYSSATKGVRET
jgi:hypothetical protein